MAAVVGKRKLGNDSAVIRCCSDSMGGTPWCHQHILFPPCKPVRGGKPPLYPALSEGSPVCLLLTPSPSLLSECPVLSSLKSASHVVRWASCRHLAVLTEKGPASWHAGITQAVSAGTPVESAKGTICAFSPACTRTEGKEASPRCCVEFRTL